jgi:hypothetical protein
MIMYTAYKITRIALPPQPDITAGEEYFTVFRAFLVVPRKQKLGSAADDDADWGM